MNQRGQLDHILRVGETSAGAINALIGALMQDQENQHLHGDDWQRTLFINSLDVGATDFDLSDDKKQALIEQGIQGAENYFHWFEDPKEQPVNRLAIDPISTWGRHRGPAVF